MSPVVVLQGSMVPLVAGLAVVVLAAVSVSQSIEVVDATERRVLTVFGEFEQVLQPGINFVPPFVSRTYSFDVRPQTLEPPAEEYRARDGERFAVAPTVEFVVEDPEQVFRSVDDHRGDLVRTARRTLRDVVERTDAETLAAEPFRPARDLRRHLERETRNWGLRVEDVELTTVERVE